METEQQQPSKTNSIPKEHQQKASVAQEALRQSFHGKMCPLLSISGLRAEASRVVNFAGASPSQQSQGDAVGCQGPACQFFIVTSADDESNPTCGACTLALTPSAILGVQQTLASAIRAIGEFMAGYRIRSKS